MPTVREGWRPKSIWKTTTMVRPSGGAVGYEIMLGGYCVKSLSDRIGSEISLYTMQYLEGSPGGGNMVPRMLGFLSTVERDFFRKFISVKGIGIARGLRSLSMPIEIIAEAIESGDQKTLMMPPSLSCQPNGRLGPMCQVIFRNGSS